MPYNITIDDISPLITYQGQWRDAFNLTSDRYHDRYLNNTFHSSRTNGAQALLQFNGTAVYIFGAKRVNHGNYAVQVDDEQPQLFDGYEPAQLDGTDGVYQVPIYTRTDLVNGLHKVVLTNRGEANQPYVDIDFVTWTSNDEAFPTNRLDDGYFDYTPANAWANSSGNVADYYGKTKHSTKYNGARASLTFEGTGIYLYGGTQDNHGAFTVILNDHPPVVMNGFTNGYHFGVLHYYADGLGPGKHNLTVINTDAEGKYLGIDYVDIVQPPSGPTSKNHAPIIAGVVCGTVAVLVVAAVVVWYLMRRKRPQSGFTDLINEPKSCIVSPPAGHISSSSGPGRNGITSLTPGEPQLDATHRHAYIRSKSNDSSAHPPEQHSGPFRASVLNTNIDVRAPARNPKGRTPIVQNTRRSNNGLRNTRIRLPDRSQDHTTSSESSDYETTEMLPPDYHQATRPVIPPRRA